MRHFWRIGLIVALLLCLVLPGGNQRAVEAQEDAPTYAQQAQALWEDLGVAERVGQVFLVTFEGDNAPLDSDIADLILNYHVGGVLLRAGNDNITGYSDPANAPAQVAELAADLQRLTLLGYSTAVSPEPTPEPDATNEALPTAGITPSPTPITPTNPIPLFIALNQEGDGPVYDHILDGLTAVPNHMALGATWKPDNAKIIGKIVGRELSAMGINMFLGPSLDVLEDLTAARSSNIGARSFGGDPYWVALMGKAYVMGLHQGANGRLAVIAKHFPALAAAIGPSIRKFLPCARHWNNC